MATFAKLDSNNIVVSTFKISDTECRDENLVEHEHLGVEYCKKIFNDPNGKYLQVSKGTYDGVHIHQDRTPIRKRFPTPGDLYDHNRDAFITQPYPWEVHVDSNNNPIYSQSDYFFDEGTCRYILRGTVYTIPRTFPNKDMMIQILEHEKNERANIELQDATLGANIA